MLQAFPTFLSGRAGLGLLVLRVVAGGAMALHGWGKIQNPFSWMGPDSWAPGWLQALAAGSEFFGGIGLALGLLTPLVCVLIGCTMLAAMFTVHFPHGDPWVGKQGSYELALNYLAIAALFLLAGPGKYSLDYPIFGKRRLKAAERRAAREPVGGWR